jgi:hypothetical protein
MVRVKDLALIACLMITLAVTTADVEPWRVAQVQKSNLALLIGVYTDGLPTQALVRGEARAVSAALDSAQGTAYTDVEARHAILEIPVRTILDCILEFISKLTTYEYIVLEIFFCLVDFGTIALLVVLHRHINRHRLFKYLDRYPTKERDGIAPLLLDLRQRTADKISLLAQWIVIGLILFAILNLVQTSASRGSQSTLSYSDFLNGVNSGRVSEVTIEDNDISGHLGDGPAFNYLRVEVATSTFLRSDPEDMGEQTLSVGRNHSTNDVEASDRPALGLPDDTKGIVFLASDDAGFMTGVGLVIDGGLTAQ